MKKSRTKNTFGLSKYHIFVIILYLIIIPSIFIFGNVRLSYSLLTNNTYPALLVFAASIVAFLTFAFYKRKIKLDLKFHHAVLSLVYGFIFAFAEEIIFRGVIQSYFQNHLSTSSTTILFSSLIFGAAHLLNKAKSSKIEDWNWKFAFLTFIAGIPLGLIFFLTGSLLIPTILHALFILILRISEKK